jgi:hypothetical protein
LTESVTPSKKSSRKVDYFGITVLQYIGFGLKGSPMAFFAGTSPIVMIVVFFFDRSNGMNGEKPSPE